MPDDLTDFIEGCGVPGCWCVGAVARERKRGWRLRGRIRLARARLGALLIAIDEGTLYG